MYTDEQARQIAERTKTLVLSTDVPGTDVQKGTLYTYDAEGRRDEWKEDAVTMQEWNAWRKTRATAKMASPGSDQNREATAPMVRNEPQGIEVRVDDLEDHGSKYVGQRVAVTAEVEGVFGPRLFKIDEAEWADLDGEVLVYLPSNFAALVREEDRVTVSGTVRMMKLADMELDFELLDIDTDATEELMRRPVIRRGQHRGWKQQCGARDRGEPDALRCGPGRRANSGSSGRQQVRGDDRDERHIWSA